MVSFAVPVLIDLGGEYFELATVSGPPATPTQVNPRDDTYSTPCRTDIVSIGEVDPAPARFIKKFGGVCNTLGIGSEFFEKMFILPRSIDAGIILSDLVFTIDIYSSYRKASRDWTGYTDAALGTGVDMEEPVPGSTITFEPQSGAVRDLTIGSDGPPTIDGDIVFTFDTGNVLLPVTGQRSQLFPFEPENDLIEELLFVTDIITGRSGLEQRRALRAQPRSSYRYSLLADGADLQKLENQIFDGQNRAVGIPLWHQAILTTAAIVSTDTTITVQSTDFSDYRVGGLAVVWTDAFTFEALQIASFTTNSITFSSPFTQAFTSGSRIMPVTTCYLSQRVRSTRFRQGLTSVDIEAMVLDNTNDLADTSAYSTYNSKVLLDDLNFLLSDSLQEAFTTQRKLLDNRTGTPLLVTDQDISRRQSSKGFITVDRESAWQVRQLLHALKGRQQSFYMPSFKNDLTAVANVNSGVFAIDVEDVQYSTLVQERQARNTIRVVLKDGTVSDPVVVTASTITAPGVDRLTVTPAINVTATVDEIERVEYVHKVRLDTDKVSMSFKDSNGNMRVGIQTKEVLG